MIDNIGNTSEITLTIFQQAVKVTVSLKKGFWDKTGLLTSETKGENNFTLLISMTKHQLTSGSMTASSSEKNKIASLIIESALCGLHYSLFFNCNWEREIFSLEELKLLMLSLRNDECDEGDGSSHKLKNWSNLSSIKQFFQNEDKCLNAMQMHHNITNEKKKGKEKTQIQLDSSSCLNNLRLPWLSHKLLLWLKYTEIVPYWMQYRSSCYRDFINGVFSKQVLTSQLEYNQIFFQKNLQNIIHEKRSIPSTSSKCNLKLEYFLKAVSEGIHGNICHMFNFLFHFSSVPTGSETIKIIDSWALRSIFCLCIKHSSWWADVLETLWKQGIKHSISFLAWAFQSNES